MMSIFWSGAVFSVTFFISGLLGPVWGVIADRKSRKLMALRASVCLAISYTLCGLVSTVEGLFAARVFQGLSAGLYPALLALVATTMPNNKIGLSMGLLQGRDDNRRNRRSFSSEAYFPLNSACGILSILPEWH